MPVVPETLVADRYKLLECLGAGGMGEVWKAQDTNFSRFVVVAVKLLKEDETFQDDDRNRQNLARYLHREASAGHLTFELIVNALDESFNAGVKRDLLRKAAEQRFRGQKITADEAISFFDELANDSTFNENARHRRRLRDLFATEANAVAILQHPNIVRVTDFGEHSGVPFLVMDYINGRTLQQVIQRREPMPLAKRLRLMEDLCEGLGYAHSKELIHRDIKPANLIIDSETERLKVLDFGVVRTMQFSAQRSVSMGAPIGTYCYMSPEQTRASRTLDNRSDIFSCGLVFYELLSYQRAFPSSGDVSELIGRIQRDPPPSLHELVPDLAAEIEAIVSRAIEKIPAKRYADLSQMQRDIQGVRRRLEQEERQASADEHGTAPLPPKPISQQVADLVDRATQAFETGDDHAVIELADQILQRAPDQPDAIELKTRANERIGLPPVPPELIRPASAPQASPAPAPAAIAPVPPTPVMPAPIAAPEPTSEPGSPPPFSGTAIGGVVTQWPVDLSHRTAVPPGAQTGQAVPGKHPVSAALAANSKVGKYTVHELIARGRTGHLYKAFDPARSRLIGLKVIDNPTGLAVSRLLRASRIWLDLRHPNLQTILEVEPGDTSGTAFIATELIEGVDLERVLKGRRLELTQKIAIAIQVCEALDYLHTRGVIHREVTPKNIVLSRDMFVTLLDSGLARSTDPTELQLTSLGASVGDARYMAPEQRIGRSDQRSDIYSLGAVLYQMLFDEEFKPSTREAARHRLTRCDTLARKLVEVLLTALNEDSAQRFETVRDLCDGLQSLMPHKLAPLNIAQAVVTLHGIRTHAAWQRAFAEVVSRAGWHCCLDRWNFGYFSAAKFMLPWSRVAKVSWFRATYHDEFGDQATSPLTVERPSIVAHSFGTYILGKALMRYPYIRFNKVLLCGSILPESFPWHTLLDRGQVQAVRNEYGARDVWTQVARTIVPGAGASGLRGFDCSHARLEQEMFDFSHSEYFEKGHMEQKWLPFLKRRLSYITPREATAESRGQANGQSRQST